MTTHCSNISLTSWNLLHEDPHSNSFSFAAQVTYNVLVLQTLVESYLLNQVLDLRAGEIR